MNKVSFLGELEQMVLLAVLRLGDEAYSMAVRTEIRLCAGRRVARGAVYITLDRLVKKGCLSSRLGDPLPERGGRARRYFALTPPGKAALTASRQALLKLWEGHESALESK
ncbi:MAG: helix-turn-helix transcriptional regulator [Acidobacteriota bacterium]